jgi:hypothetical protein
MMTSPSGNSLLAVARTGVDLPAPLGPMMPTMAPAGNREAQVVDQHAVTEGLGDIVELDDLVAQTRRPPGWESVSTRFWYSKSLSSQNGPGVTCSWPDVRQGSGVTTPVPLDAGAAGFLAL